MASLNSLFRRLRRVCDAYMDDMNLGELQDLVEQLQKQRREKQRFLHPRVSELLRQSPDPTAGDP